MKKSKKGVRASLKHAAFEKHISPEQFEKFQKRALRRDKSDLEFDSMEEGIQHLKR